MVTVSDTIEIQPSALAKRLLHRANPDGGWGYSIDGPSFAEPTALSCLALAVQGIEHEAHGRGLHWLTDGQGPDGRIPVMADDDSPAWPTGLALLAWASADVDEVSVFQPHIDRAVHWLLTTSGQSLPLNRDIFGHDTTLQGWSWVVDTHSWVEPTAYAIMALKSQGYADHPRVREGVRLLLDRAIAGGGWNYGNTRVLANTLRPFPATTGIVLSALAGEDADPRIEASIAYLADELQEVRSPLSLGWGLIGLTVWRTRPAKADHWLNECTAQTGKQPTGHPTNTIEEAVVLLAARGDDFLLHLLERRN